MSDNPYTTIQIEVKVTSNSSVCFCIGKQGNDPYCPCEMRQRGLIKIVDNNKEQKT